MSLIANRLSVIKPSPTIAVSTRAAELKSAGQDVISLGAGEPDFDTPEHVKEAAKKAMAEGKTKYTAVDGIPELKQAVVDKFAQDNNIKCTTGEVTVGTGGKQVLYNAFMATLNEGDEVIIPAPYWVSYVDIVRLSEGKPVIVLCSDDAQFKITPEQLEAAITPKTKWLILNNPSNPTGAGYSEAELMALAEVIRQHDHVHVLSDDIYEYIIYDDFVFKTFAEIAPDLRDRTLTLNGVSKAYCMTGWRIGYASAQAPLIKAMATIQSQSTSSPNSIAQYAALAALQGSMDFLVEKLKAFDARRKHIVKTLNAIDGITCLNPQGAFYVFPCVKELIGRKRPDGKVISNDSDFVAWLLDDGGVATVQGAAFGVEGYFRISYATSMELLEDAGGRIRQSVEKLS